MKKRKKKEPQVHRVYVTYYPDGTYYIGYSGKPAKQYEKYFGSAKAILTLIKENPDDHGLVKETIAEFSKKSYAKMQEFLLQWQQRGDPRCLNDMLNVRLRRSHLEDFQPVDWKPRP